MSLILDALRRHSSAERPPDDDHKRPSRAERILTALGYPNRRTQQPASPARIVGYGVAALAGGFAATAGVILLFSPAAPRVPSQAARTVSPGVLTTIAQSTARREPPEAQGIVGVSERPSPDAQPAPEFRHVAPSAPPPERSPSPGRPMPRPIPSRSAERTERSVTAGEATAATRLATAAAPAPPESKQPASAPQAATPQPDHFALALYYQRVGDVDAALAQYRTLLDDNDRRVEVHNNLGLLYQYRNQPADAVREFQRAISIEPRYAKAHNNLGVALARAGRLDQAAAEFRVALETDPRNVESLVNLALVNRTQGRSAEARDLLVRAVRMDPRNAGSHYNLAVVADETGNVALALEHYQAFLKLGTVDRPELAAQVRTRIAALASSE